MGWSNGGKFGAPTLRNYEQAKAHFEGTKPIRGSNLVPIGNRRKQQARIMEGRDGDIVCRLYNTDVLTYHKDDSITLTLGGWSSTSTRAFINEILPDAGVHSANGQPWFDGYAVNGDGKIQLGNWLLGSHKIHRLERREVPQSSRYTFVFPEYVLLNPEPVVQHRILRKEANAVRETYLPFKKYVVGMVKVMEEMLGTEHYTEFRRVTGLVHPYSFKHLESVMPRAASGNPEDMFVAMVGLIYAHHKYHIFRDDVDAVSRMGIVKASINAMLKTLDQAILYANRDTCFEEISSLNGEILKDNNRAFFN